MELETKVGAALAARGTLVGRDAAGGRIAGSGAVPRLGTERRLHRVRQTIAAAR